MEAKARTVPPRLLRGLRKMLASSENSGIGAGKITPKTVTLQASTANCLRGGTQGGPFFVDPHLASRVVVSHEHITLKVQFVLHIEQVCVHRSSQETFCTNARFKQSSWASGQVEQAGYE